MTSKRKKNTETKKNKPALLSLKARWNRSPFLRAFFNPTKQIAPQTARKKVGFEPLPHLRSAVPTLYFPVYDLHIPPRFTTKIKGEKRPFINSVQ